MLLPEEVAQLHALPDDALLTVKEAAHVLRLKVETLNYYRCNRPDYGPRFVRVGGRIRYAMGALREYIARQEMPADSAAGRPPHWPRAAGSRHMDEKKKGPGDGESRGPKRRNQKQESHCGVNDASRSGPATPLFTGNVEPIVEAGLTVIPLHRWDAVDKKGRDRGKSPKDGAWQARQYDSERVIASASATGRNLGVRLSPDWLVLDVDPRNFPGGRDVLAEFVRDLSLDLTACPYTVTGSGGHHYWFRKFVDISTIDSLEGYPGVEFKSAGRQVVAPGSVHPCGRRYEWDDLAPSLSDAPALPANLVSRIRRPERKSSGGGAGELTPERLARTLEHLDPCDFGEHDAWCELMMACHHATDGEGRQEFIDWSTGDPNYADDAWIIGRRWDSLHSDRGGGVVTIATLVKALKERGKILPPPDAAEDFDEWIDDEPPAKSRARWALLRPSEMKSLPPPRWLIEDLLPEAVPAVIYGPPASGKSFLALDLALCVALGRPWHDRKVQRGNVLYIAAEGARGRRTRRCGDLAARAERERCKARGEADPRRTHKRSRRRRRLAVVRAQRETHRGAADRALGVEKVSFQKVTP